METLTVEVELQCVKAQQFRVRPALCHSVCPSCHDFQEFCVTASEAFAPVGKHFTDRHAHREHINLCSLPLAMDNFWGDVANGEIHNAGTRGAPEVTQLEMPWSEAQDVIWLDVAV